jgi:hypothetical protein
VYCKEGIMLQNELIFKIKSYIISLNPLDLIE